MLREIPDIYQIPGEPFRRWFAGENMDLIVWFHDDHTDFQGFQFCYRQGHSEMALTWLDGKGYTHETISDGEERPGLYKMAPIMLRKRTVQKEDILNLFLSRSEYLERSLIEFIRRKIRDLPDRVR